MNWWNDLLAWAHVITSKALFTTAVIPFVAIIVSGIIGALIGRGATSRMIAQRNHDTRAAAIAALVAAGEGAATWHSQAPASKEHAERLASQADVSVRLLPISGASLAADWASHQLREMRTNSVSYSYQAEQTLDEYRDRLIEWMYKPKRAKKLFSADLDRWKYAESAVDPVVLDQQRWAEEQYSSVSHELVPHESAAPAVAPAAMPVLADSKLAS